MKIPLFGVSTKVQAIYAILLFQHVAMFGAGPTGTDLKPRDACQETNPVSTFRDASSQQANELRGVETVRRASDTDGCVFR